MEEKRTYYQAFDAFNTPMFYIKGDVVFLHPTEVHNLKTNGYNAGDTLVMILDVRTIHSTNLLEAQITYYCNTGKITIRTLDESNGQSISRLFKKVYY